MDYITLVLAVVAFVLGFLAWRNRGLNEDEVAKLVGAVIKETMQNLNQRVGELGGQVKDLRDKVQKIDEVLQDVEFVWDDKPSSTQHEKRLATSHDGRSKVSVQAQKSSLISRLLMGTLLLVVLFVMGTCVVSYFKGGDHVGAKKTSAVATQQK